MTTRTTQFFYDAVGNRTKVVDPDNRTTYYTYDKVNRLTGISVNPDSKSADYYFDKRGLVTTEVKPNSAVTYYEYDDAGRMTKLDNRKSDLSLISSFEYDRDKSGNITKCYRGDTATIYYTYDKAQRLASEVWKDSGMSTIYSYQYDYDGVGNRTKLLRNLGGGAKSIYYYYDAANRLEKEWNTTPPPATTYFYYNDNGSVTEIVNGSGTTYFEYNDSDLVKKVTRGATENEFYYDGRNQRVVISDSDGTSYFDWDGINPVEEYGDTDAKYIHGYSPVAGAGSLAYAKRSSDYQIPHKDHIGSTRELSDASEVVTQYYEYDGFGTELEDTGSETNRFQFASSYMKLKDLDNVYLSPTRVYHAGIGRFLGKDFFHSVNRYPYARNCPLALIDPLGLSEMLNWSRVRKLRGKEVGVQLKGGTWVRGILDLVEPGKKLVILTRRGWVTVCSKDIAGQVLQEHRHQEPGERFAPFIAIMTMMTGAILPEEAYNMLRIYKMLHGAIGRSEIDLSYTETVVKNLKKCIKKNQQALAEHIKSVERIDFAQALASIALILAGGYFGAKNTGSFHLSLVKAALLEAGQNLIISEFAKTASRITRVAIPTKETQYKHWHTAKEVLKKHGTNIEEYSRSWQYVPLRRPPVSSPSGLFDWARGVGGGVDLTDVVLSELMKKNKWTEFRARQELRTLSRMSGTETLPLEQWPGKLRWYYLALCTVPRPSGVVGLIDDILGAPTYETHFEKAVEYYRETESLPRYEMRAKSVAKHLEYYKTMRDFYARQLYRALRLDRPR